jgi:thiosulfate dehydrogenase
MTENNETYFYPPLWGMQSYAQGSSMHRMITAARFVKWSMPYTDTISPPQLADEEVFDVVAFINCDSIHPRPYRPLEKDCPDLLNKPIDFPWGPFLDTFPARQHKYGPFKPIKEFYAKLKKEK